MSLMTCDVPESKPQMTESLLVLVARLVIELSSATVMLEGMSDCIDSVEGGCCCCNMRQLAAIERLDEESKVPLVTCGLAFESKLQITESLLLLVLVRVIVDAVDVIELSSDTIVILEGRSDCISSVEACIIRLMAMKSRSRERERERERLMCACV